MNIMTEFTDFALKEISAKYLLLVVFSAFKRLIVTKSVIPTKRKIECERNESNTGFVTACN